MGNKNLHEKTPLAIALSIASSADQKGKSEPLTKKAGAALGKNFYLRKATYVRCVRRGPCCPRGPPPCPLSRPSPATPNGVAPQYRSNLSPRAKGGLPRGIRGRIPRTPGNLAPAVSVFPPRCFSWSSLWPLVTDGWCTEGGPLPMPLLCPAQQALLRMLPSRASTTWTRRCLRPDMCGTRCVCRKTEMFRF